MRKTIKETNTAKINQKLFKMKLMVKIRIVKIYFHRIQTKFKLELLLQYIQIKKCCKSLKCRPYQNLTIAQKVENAKLSYKD